MTGIELIKKEREDQLLKHGIPIYGDVRYNSMPTSYHDLTPLILGAIYILDDSGEFIDKPEHWDEEMLENILSKDYEDRLVIAGALIAAEIDRVQYIENPKLDTK